MPDLPDDPIVSREHLLARSETNQSFDTRNDDALSPHDALIYATLAREELRRAEAQLESARRHGGNERHARIAWAKFRIRLYREQIAFLTGATVANEPTGDLSGAE